MKFLDCYKISWHDIRANKSRSLLTTLIVYIISLLIMALLLLGLSFGTNYEEIIKTYYKEGAGEIRINYYGNPDIATPLNKDNFASFRDIIKDYDYTISNIIFDSNSSYSSDLSLTDANISVNYEDFRIIEGRNLNASDEGTNNIIVSQEYLAKYTQKYSRVLSIGDKLTYEYGFYDETARSYTYLDMEFNIVGIFRDENTENSYSSRPRSIVLDAQYMFDHVDNYVIKSFEINYNTTRTNFSSTELTNNIKTLTTTLQDKLGKNVYDTGESDSVYCSALDEFKMATVIKWVVLGLMMFLCLILALLSIGSLANTIMISVDKNRKFIGLLKAMGAKEKHLKRIIKLESITTILFGILLSFVTILIFKPLITQLFGTLMTSTMTSYLTQITYTPVFSTPIYIPVLVGLFFVLLTLMFARKSMSKVVKMDPMTIISEVA